MYGSDPFAPELATSASRPSERSRVAEAQAAEDRDAVITIGRTEMAGRYDGALFTAASRYTHVLALGDDRRWRLATAQGTRICDTDDSASRYAEE